jgi:hypothetical protein
MIVISPVIAISLRTGRPVSAETIPVTMVIPADQFLDLGPDVARAYGCQEFAETDADGHVLVFGLCG